MKSNSFTRHLRRFFIYCLKAMWSSVRQNVRFKVVITIGKFIAVMLLILAGVALISFVLGVLALTITILTQSWLHFSEDFRTQYLPEMMLGGFAAGWLSILLFGIFQEIADHFVRFFGRAWRETSSKTLARNLFE